MEILNNIINLIILNGDSPITNKNFGMEFGNLKNTMNDIEIYINTTIEIIVYLSILYSNIIDKINDNEVEKKNKILKFPLNPSDGTSVIRAITSKIRVRRSPFRSGLGIM